MESRRKILQKIGLGTVMSSLGFWGTTQYAPFLNAQKNGEAPWWLLAPFKQGSQLGLGWSIVSLSAIEKGAAILTLQHHEKDVARIHICAHNGLPKGLAHTNLLDFLLMDGGQGNHPTEESVGRVLLGLAERMQKDEERLIEQGYQISQLQTHEERLLLYQDEGLT